MEETGFEEAPWKVPIELEDRNTQIKGEDKSKGLGLWVQTRGEPGPKKLKISEMLLQEITITQHYLGCIYYGDNPAIGNPNISEKTPILYFYEAGTWAQLEPHSISHAVTRVDWENHRTGGMLINLVYTTLLLRSFGSKNVLNRWLNTHVEVDNDLVCAEKT